MVASAGLQTFLPWGPCPAPSRPFGQVRKDVDKLAWPQRPCCLDSQPLRLSGPEAAGGHVIIYRALPPRGGHHLDVNATLLVSSLTEKSRDIYRGGSPGTSRCPDPLPRGGWHEAECGTWGSG